MQCNDRGLNGRKRDRRASELNILLGYKETLPHSRKFLQRLDPYDNYEVLQVAQLCSLGVSHFDEIKAYYPSAQTLNNIYC